jgi:hypothetical protein
MVYNYMVLGKFAPALVVLGGITGFLEYERYQCQKRTLKTTTVSEPIVLFPNCKWEYYIPPFSPQPYDDQTSSSQTSDQETCEITRIRDNYLEGVSSYCKAMTGLSIFFEAATFGLLGSAAMLGGFPETSVHPSGVTASAAQD